MGKTYRKTKTGNRTWRILDNIDYDHTKSDLRNNKIRTDLFLKEDMRMEALQ
tara:strand:- start:707 stop:862 length:156 start_codon:yes stop_codon:yes gene_type:complete